MQIRRLLGALAIALLAATAIGCTGSQAPLDGPAGVVQTALDKVAAKDLDGLRTLACAGQEDLIRDQIGLPAAIGSQLLPGVDTQALLDAVKLDVSKVQIGSGTQNGSTASVPVTGTLGVTFDPTAVRPILKQLLATQGTTMTDDQLDALIKTLATYGQAVPLDQSIRLVQEGGAWKICQEDLVPAAS